MTQAETIARGAPKATASESKAMPKVELRDIGLRYYTRAGEVEALRSVSVDIAPGEFVSIVGPSGFCPPNISDGKRFRPVAIREVITASCNGETET